MADKASLVVVVGGGAWGLSTAFYLQRAGYRNITVFDRAERIPSQYSAGHDLNKIVRADYEDDFYCKLALEAIEGWKTPIFAPHYHQTGYIVATTRHAPGKAVDHWEKTLATITANSTLASEVDRLECPADFQKYLWQQSHPPTGLRGYYNRVGGYAHSADAMKRLWTYCASHGVRFVLGDEAGHVSELVYENNSTADNKSRKCIGVRTKNGHFYDAHIVVCAAGAYNASLVPSLGRFTTARCWPVCHVQLTEDEADLLRGIPTTNIRDLGFLFEPDPKTRLLKLCPLGVGYTNTNEVTGLSLPPQDQAPSSSTWENNNNNKVRKSLSSLDHVPAQDEQKLRQLLRVTFPWMSQRPLVGNKMCWFSDTRDSNYCIDFVPGTQKSVICLTGDSGHGFKMFPIFGKWVLDMLVVGEQREERWRWKEQEAKGNENRKDRWGDEVSWRIGQEMELSEVLHVERMGETAGNAKL